MTKKPMEPPASATGIIPDLDQLVRLPLELSLVVLAQAGAPVHAELKRQKEVELVSEYGELVIDGKLLKPDILYALEATEGLRRAIEAGWLIDQGVKIPSGWIVTKDGRIIKP
jgi:hypothetical protein